MLISQSFVIFVSCLSLIAYLKTFHTFHTNHTNISMLYKWISENKDLSLRLDEASHHPYKMIYIDTRHTILHFTFLILNFTFFIFSSFLALSSLLFFYTYSFTHLLLPIIPLHIPQPCIKLFLKCFIHRFIGQVVCKILEFFRKCIGLLFFIITKQAYDFSLEPIGLDGREKSLRYFCKIFKCLFWLMCKDMMQSANQVDIIFGRFRINLLKCTQSRIHIILQSKAQSDEEGALFHVGCGRIRHHFIKPMFLFFSCFCC